MTHRALPSTIGAKALEAAVMWWNKIKKQEDPELAQAIERYKQELIDLKNPKPKTLDEAAIEGRKIHEKLRQFRIKCEAEIGKDVRRQNFWDRRFAQMIEANRRRLGPAQKLAGEQAAMTGDHVQFGADQDRDIESEGLKAGACREDLLGFFAFLRPIPIQPGDDLRNEFRRVAGGIALFDCYVTIREPIAACLVGCEIKHERGP
jgi:hypothetical protein